MVARLYLFTGNAVNIMYYWTVFFSIISDYGPIAVLLEFKLELNKKYVENTVEVYL